MRGILSDSRLSVSIRRDPRTAFATSSRADIRCPKHFPARAGLGLGWVEHSEFRVSVPKKRKVDFFLYVADVDDPKNADMRPFECRVRPR